jgi:hypothetical protein
MIEDGRLIKEITNVLPTVKEEHVLNKLEITDPNLAELQRN